MAGEGRERMFIAGEGRGRVWALEQADVYDMWGQRMYMIGEGHMELRCV